MSKSKLFTIYLLCIFCSNNLYSQALSLNDLINFSSMSPDKFDTYASDKNFRYSKTEKNDFATSQMYKSGTSTLSDKSEYWLTLNFNYPSGFNIFQSVSYQTISSMVYNKIKAQLITYNFSYVKRDVTEDGSLRLEYRKGNKEVALFSGEFGNKTTYEISVSINK